MRDQKDVASAPEETGSGSGLPGTGTSTEPPPAGGAPPEVTYRGAADRALSTRQLAWRRFRRHKLAMASAVVLLILGLAAVFAKLVTPYDFKTIDILHAFQGPSAKHWF